MLLKISIYGNFEKNNYKLLICNHNKTHYTILFVNSYIISKLQFLKRDLKNIVQN